MDRLVRLCAASELAEGCARGFDPTSSGRDTLFVVRRGGLHAYLNACPHWAGTPMAWRKDAYLSADGTRIVCAAHGAQFDIETGHCTLGPCLGRRLTRITVTEGPDGALRLDPGALQASLRKTPTE